MAHSLCPRDRQASAATWPRTSFSALGASAPAPSWSRSSASPCCSPPPPPPSPPPPPLPPPRRPPTAPPGWSHREGAGSRAGGPHRRADGPPGHLKLLAWGRRVRVGGACVAVGRRASVGRRGRPQPHAPRFGRVAVGAARAGARGGAGLERGWFDVLVRFLSIPTYSGVHGRALERHAAQRSPRTSKWVGPSVRRSMIEIQGDCMGYPV